MMSTSLNELIALIREHQGLENKEINEFSLLEQDLGITGDDGYELIAAIEAKFKVCFRGPDGSLKQAFNLDENESLFHGEGIDLIGAVAELFGKKTGRVKPITIGELYAALCRAKERPAHKQ